MAVKLGWIVAGILVVGLLVVVIVGVFAPSVTGPTMATLQEGFMNLKGGDISPAAVIGSNPSGGGNAGDNYARAASVAEASELEIARNSPAGMKAMKSIASHVAAGAAKEKMEYTLTHTPRSFRIGYVYQPARDLQRVGGALRLLAAQYHKRKNYREAEKVLQDMLVMGWHMMRERARPHMVQCGLGVQRQALEGLKAVYAARGGQPAGKIAALANYRQQLYEVTRSYADKHKVCWRTQSHPGDVCNIVENDRDRAWRVQGLLSLGLIKFTADKKGDRKRAESLLKRFVGSSDPFEAAAAKAAIDLTADQLHGLGRRF